MGESMAETEKIVNSTKKASKPAALGRKGYPRDRPKAAGLRSGGRKETDRAGRDGLSVRVNRVRIGFVVGGGVIEARLDDPVGRWGRSGSDANALLPQAEVT